MSMPDHGHQDAREILPGDVPTDGAANELHAAGPQAETTEEEAIPESPAPRTGWRLFCLIPNDGREPPASVSDDLAQACWCAVSALWHPSILARAAELPRLEPIETPSSPGAREIRLVPEGSQDRLPSGYLTQAEDAGALVLEAGTDRAAVIRQLQERLGAVGTPETSDDPGMIAVADDFLALGTTRWLLRDMAVAMGHPDAINHEALARELLTGADAWQACDRTTAVNRLRAGFEILTQARERFYPVDAYIVDLCLLDPALPAGVLAGPLQSSVAISFVAQGEAIERQAYLDPEGLERLRQAITEGWVDVAGGSYSEVEDSLLPLGSVIWQFQRGAVAYRAHLDERNVETYARRRFGLYTQLPQIAKRFGLRFGLHLAFDAGRFPIRPEPKRLWESPDGSSLESLLRPPLAADRPSQGMLAAWRMASTMRNDHVATLPLVHWPSPVASWYLDLRRGATYSPAFGRWVTLNDFFHHTDRPYETFRPDPDSYVTPYLCQAVARGDDRPISRIARHHALRARWEAGQWLRALALGISSSVADSPAPPAEQGETPDDLATAAAIEEHRHDEASEALDRAEPLWADSLAKSILRSQSAATGDARPGYLVLNPLGVPRRVAVILPDAALDLRPEGPLRAAQFTDEGVSAVVDVPAFGFAWVPRDPNVDQPPAQPGGLSARGRVLRNESIELEIDETTGGIRGLMAAGESTPRLGQQLVMAGLDAKGGKPETGQMKARKFDLDFAGPALVQATSSGVIVDPGSGGTLATFTQRYRLWTGRPILELDITLDELAAAWCDRARRGNPWECYLACRWAWPDPTSVLRRTVLLAPELTELQRPETPDALDISTRRQRTALLFGGLPYHQKHGNRMLDTLLVAGAESARAFRLGVVLDLEHPFQAAQDLLTPPPVVPTDAGPPSLGSSGWLLHADQKSVAVTHVGFLPSTGEGRGWGLDIHLLETAGQSSRCRVRFFRSPAWARQVDFQGELVIDLTVDGDGVLVDLTPNELGRLEVTLG
ncbi:MAG: glycosyl hydrolase family 38 [Isosphaeraceae bacterium]